MIDITRIVYTCAHCGANEGETAEVKAQLAEQQGINEALTEERDALKAENAKLREALEKIADPRKRDHGEPDAYTQLGCVMNIAAEALAADVTPSTQTSGEKK